MRKIIQINYMNADEIIPNFKEPEFKDVLLFELTSFIGRKFLKRRSKFPQATEIPYLVDIGVGNNYTSEWIHLDFFHIRYRFWKKINHKKPEVQWDLRYPLRCPDSICDGCYSSHTLEHLYPDKAYQLLSEIHRILKPGCWLRIVLPDLKRVVDYYNGIIKIPEYTFGAEAISNATQNWGHHSAWDEDLLTYALKNVGFTNIKKVKYGEEGSDKRLIKDLGFYNVLSG